MKRQARCDECSMTYYGEGAETWAKVHSSANYHMTRVYGNDGGYELVEQTYLNGKTSDEISGEVDSIESDDIDEADDVDQSPFEHLTTSVLEDMRDSLLLASVARPGSTCAIVAKEIGEVLAARRSNDGKQKPKQKTKPATKQNTSESEYIEL